MNTRLSRLVATTCTTLLTGTIVTGNVFAQQPADDAAKLAAACNAFATTLHAQLANGAEPTCSPASISIALLMLLPAARGNTEAELTALLELPDGLRGDRLHAAASELLSRSGLVVGREDRRGKRLLRISNDLWVHEDYELVPAYADVLRGSFSAAVQRIDFEQCEAARQRINDHIAKATNDRIRDLIPAGLIVPTTRVILTNALWFKAAWKHPFWKEATKPRPFTLADGAKVDVPTMHLAKPLAYSESDDWQCVALPFEDTAIRCEIVLPREGVPLATAEAAMLSGDCLGTLRAETVRVALPRFRVAARHGLKSALQALGLRDAFSPGAADFSGMSPKNDLFLSDVVHRTWIDVDENGAEAAAATAAVLEAKSARPGEPKDFIANRPFGFVLRDADTGLILFVGRVSDPRTQQD
jgi:serpin B